MDYATVTDPRWVDTEHTAILCRVRFAAFDIDIPFMAMPGDPHGHGRTIFADCLAGRYGRVRECDEPAIGA